MKKKYFYLTVMLIVFLLSLNIKVEAADTCSASELKELKAEVSNMTFSYEFVDDIPESLKEDGWDAEYYYTLKIYDYNSKFIINFGSNYFDSTYANKDGDLEATDTRFYGGAKITFYILGSDETNCEWTTITKKTITFPYYNKYSEYEECEGYEELDICKTTSNTESVTSDEQFLTLLESAKASLIEETNETTAEDGIISKVVDFYLEYKIITIPLTIIIVLLVIIIIVILINKNKKRVKIDLGGKL